MELGNMEIYSTATSIVDIMNAFLILICSIFAIVIVGTLRDKKLESIVRSVHFLSIDKIITAWTLIGSSILLLAIVEILYAVKIVTDRFHHSHSCPVTFHNDGEVIRIACIFVTASVQFFIEIVK